MKYLLAALICLIGVALAAPSTTTKQDKQMKQLMGHIAKRDISELYDCM